MTNTKHMPAEMRAEMLCTHGGAYPVGSVVRHYAVTKENAAAAILDAEAGARERAIEEAAVAITDEARKKWPNWGKDQTDAWAFEVANWAAGVVRGLSQTRSR